MPRSRFLARLASVVLAVGGCVLGAAPAARAILQLARPCVRSYGQRDGLPDPTLHGIARDQQGRIWAATQGGAAIYDGGRWTPFLLPPEAPSQYLRQVYPDGDGSFWFATQETGIWHLQTGQWSHHGTGQGLPTDRVHQVLRVAGPADQEGLWAATEQGPCRLEGAVWVAHPLGLGARFTWRIVQGGTNLWACTRGGLALWRDGRWHLEAALQGQEVNDFLERRGPGGALERWASVWSRGLLRWDGSGWQVEDPASGAPGRFPTCLALSRDAQGVESLWAGTYDQGLARLCQGGWQRYTPDRGLRSLGVYCLLPDPSGQPTLWVGMLGGGITALSLEGWSTLPVRRLGLDSSEVTGVLEAQEGSGRRLWFATGTGVIAWDGRTWQVENSRKGLPPQGLGVLAAGPGGLYLGGESGLWRRHPAGTWSRVAGLPREPVHALLASPGAHGPGLWIGTAQGLYRLERDRVLSVPLDGPVDVRSLAETDDGSLWVGTRAQGIRRRLQGRWTRLDPVPRFQDINLFTCLHSSRGERGQSVLWAASRGNGLARLDLSDPAGTWSIYDATGKLPLPNTVILGLLEDHQGRLFLSTSAGVVRLTFGADRRTLTAVDTYTSGDGLAGTLGETGAGMVDADNRIWVCALDSVAFLEPALVPALRPLPAPVLSQINFPGGRGALPADGRLRHWQNHVELDFFLPVYHREEDQRFRSQLLGLEPEPGPWRFERSRDLLGLPAGAYTLRIWARDHSGRISPPLDLAFRILPAPWVHPLAFAAYALLLVAGILLYLRVRTRLLRKRNLWLTGQVEAAMAEVRAQEAELVQLNTELQRRNEEKNQFLGIAAHDLKNPLQGILFSAERLGGLPDPVARSVGERIRQSVTGMVQLINGLLDISVIEAGGSAPLRRVAIAPLLEQAQARAAQAAQSKGLEVIVEPVAEGLQASTHPDYLAEVLDNLISNALKFTPPGPPLRRVRLGASGSQDGVVLRVMDEGPGFTAEDQALAFTRFAKLSAQPTAGEGSTGLGLSIVRKLMERLDGRIDLQSEPGQGATFSIHLPG